MFFFFEVRPLILESRREKWREFEVEAEAEAEAGTAFSPPLVQEGLSTRQGCFYSCTNQMELCLKNPAKLDYKFR